MLPVSPAHVPTRGETAGVVHDLVPKVDKLAVSKRVAGQYELINLKVSPIS